jgi:hypothetical protein
MQRGFWRLHQGRLLYYTNPSYGLPTPHSPSNLSDGIETQGRNCSGGLWCRSRKRGEEVAPEGGSLPEREKRFPLFLSLFGSITGRDNKALSLSGTTSLSSRRIRRRRRRRRWSPQRARAPHIVVGGGRRKSLFLFFSGSCPASFGLQSTNPATCYLIGNPPSKERERLLTTITTRTTTTCIHCVTSFLL